MPRGWFGASPGVGRGWSRSRDGSVLLPVLRPRGTPLDAAPRFAFSRPVILGGVTDNSVSAGRGQRIPGGTHLPVLPERRQHRSSLPSILQAFRALCTREKLLAAFGPFPVRLSTANTYSYRKGERGGRARPRGSRFPRSSLPFPRSSLHSPAHPSIPPLIPPFPRSSLLSRSGCAVPGVRGAPAEAAGPGPAGQRWVAPSLPPQPHPLAVLSSRVPLDTLYFFGDNNFTEWGPLFQHYVPPPFRIPGTSPAYSFGIAGGCGMGTRGMGVGRDWGGLPSTNPRFHRRLRLWCSLPLARPWFLRGDFWQEGEN